MSGNDDIYREGCNECAPGESGRARYRCVRCGRRLCIKCVCEHECFTPSLRKRLKELYEKETGVLTNEH